MSNIPNVRYCLQHKTKWYDGDTWWITQNFSDSYDYLLEHCLPNLKQHDREEKASSSLIEGFEYRIVLEVVISENL